MGDMIAQGDVLLIPVASIPADAKARKETEYKSNGRKKLRRHVLALGESSGHAHVVDACAVEVFERNGTLFLKVNEPTTLDHVHLNTPGLPKTTDHSPVPMKVMSYEVRPQLGYAAAERAARRVAD